MIEFAPTPVIIVKFTENCNRNASVFPEDTAEYYMLEPHACVQQSFFFFFFCILLFCNSYKN